MNGPDYRKLFSLLSNSPLDGSDAPVAGPPAGSYRGEIADGLPPVGRPGLVARTARVSTASPGRDRTVWTEDGSPPRRSWLGADSVRRRAIADARKGEASWL